MKRTGPTKEATRMLIRQLEKASVCQKRALWKTIAQQIGKPRRERCAINVQKLEKLSQKFAKKTMVVPGKVLAAGNLTKPISVAALEYSELGRQKIKSMKGNAWTLEELLESKVKPSEIVIVK
ncbi:MAG: 50S ribosomal protein L18e [Candidatus Micrarchaeota archaeon]